MTSYVDFLSDNQSKSQHMLYVTLEYSGIFNTILPSIKFENITFLEIDVNTIHPLKLYFSVLAVSRFI